MKKFLVALLVAMLALSCVAMAGDYDAETWYEHLNKYHNKGVTYTEDDDPYALTIKAKDLDYFKLPTCTEQGWCKHDDGEKDIIFHLEPLGHKWDDGEITHGSCTEGATLTQECTRAWRENGEACGEVKTSTITTTHKYGTVVVQKRTCVDALITYEGCVDCGQPKGVKKLFTWWVGGTDGKTKKIDGETYYFGGADYAPYDLPDTTDKNEAATNPDTVHKLLSPWMTTEEPDCVNPGVKYRACPYCGYEQTDVLAKLNHSFDKKDNCGEAHTAHKTVTLHVNIANCKTVALYLDVVYCKHEGCNAYQVQDGSTDSSKNKYNAKEYVALDEETYTWLKPLDKAYYAIDEMYNANELKNIYFYAYKVDGEWVAEKGHHIVDESKTVYEVTKAPTCIEKGTFSQATYCSVCKGIIPELSTSDYKGTLPNTLDKAKHTYGEWEHLFDASEDSDFVSYWRRQCSVCLKYETSVEGPCGKYNHQAAAPVKENEVKATFTAAGSYEEVVYCSVCEIELSRDEKVEPMKEGLNPADGKIWEDGKAIEGTGMVEFNGGKFYVVDGVLQNAMGVTNVGGEFLFLAHGQLQEVSQLAEYDGEWFVVEDGKVLVDYNGLYPYNGAKCLIGAGRYQAEQTTLYYEDGVWYLISAGNVATGYTGVFTYDGVDFQVEAGIVK